MIGNIVGSIDQPDVGFGMLLTNPGNTIKLVVYTRNTAIACGQQMPQEVRMFLSSSVTLALLLLNCSLLRGDTIALILAASIIIE